MIKSDTSLVQEYSRTEEDLLTAVLPVPLPVAVLCRLRVPEERFAELPERLPEDLPPDPPAVLFEEERPEEDLPEEDRAFVVREAVRLSADERLFPEERPEAADELRLVAGIKTPETSVSEWQDQNTF